MRRYLLLPVFFLLFFGLIPSVHACQIMSQPETIDIVANTSNASTVLVGEVSNISYGSDNTEWVAIVEVEVEQYLKGGGFSLVEFTVFCSSYAELGNRYIFFLNPSADGSYIPAFPLEPYAYEPTIPATSENIAAIQAITGQSSLPHGLPLDTQLMRFLGKNWQWLSGTTIILLSLGYTLLSFKRRPERKTKMKREEML